VRQNDSDSANVTHTKSGERQRRAWDWAVSVYGAISRGRRYQAFRFLEEALELAQNQGLSFEDMVRVARYVSDRKVGDTKVEIGDVALCLDILAENLGLSVDGCLTSCLSRIQSLDPEACRAKDQAKIAYGLI
jgi:hypothetical protein